ncbi:DUF1573 domain-containing protein [Candidatus Poribacteria bacterium]|nr:DUF1573 domain-containing protein [Candidatus Poribacteria bacterium]
MAIRKIINLLIFPLTLISFTFLMLVNNQKELPGYLVLERDIVEFGEVPEWEGKTTRSVRVWNKGEKKVKIERIESDCGYVRVEGPKEIKPGDEAEFKVILDPKSVRSDRSAGAVIFTDSPRTPYIYLTVDAKVRRFAELSAEVCDFGEVLPGSIHEKKVLLWVNIPMEIEEIKLAPPSSDVLSWRMEERGRSECILRVKLGPLRKKGRFSSALTILFPDGRTMMMPVIAKVISPVRVKPRHIFFGEVFRGDNPTAEISFESDSPFRIRDLLVPQHLKIEGEWEGKRQTRFVLKVRWLTKSSPDFLRERIKMMTDVDPEPIQVPVYGLIGKRSP